MAESYPTIREEIQQILPKLKVLRRKLHQHAELSGEEKQTAQIMADFLRMMRPSQLITGVGGHGLLVVFDSAAVGPTIALRAELDALPIEEKNKFAHISMNRGVAHKCGHDGHMAILAGIAALLIGHPLTRGRLVLLLQPAEETGQGARRMVDDARFQSFQPDYILALHNFPGFPFGQVILKKGPIFCASRGMIIHLKGKSAHAANPEQGVNPALAMSELIKQLLTLPDDSDLQNVFAAVTIVHTRMGEMAFGTSPGEAVVMCTLRTEKDPDMEMLVKKAGDRVAAVSEKHGLGFSVGWSDVFQATDNDAELIDRLEETANELGIDVHHLDKAFRPSEDLGVFTSLFPGALFGMGAGEDYPGLHQDEYDFPDDLLVDGVLMLWHSAQRLLNQK